MAPDAYGFLGSVMADFQWSPIYAKMNVAGKRIYHHDVFFTAGLGGTLERAIQPDASTTVRPLLARASASASSLERTSLCGSSCATTCSSRSA